MPFLSVHALYASLNGTRTPSNISNLAHSPRSASMPCQISPLISPSSLLKKRVTYSVSLTFFRSILLFSHQRTNNQCSLGMRQRIDILKLPKLELCGCFLVTLGRFTRS